MTEDRAPGGSQEPLDTAYDVALLALDGVVYLGGTAIPGAAEALRKADAAGMRLAYVTNNAFRTPAAIAALWTSFGAPASPQDVVTSAQAAARLLAERLPAGASVLVIGGSGLRMALRERGLRPVSTAADKPQAVVQGYSPDVNYSMLAEGGLAVAEDLTGLLEPHPEINAEDGAFGCRGWTARMRGDQLELDGDGERIDGLRALCAAAWAEAGDPDATVSSEAAQDALQRLER